MRDMGHFRKPIKNHKDVTDVTDSSSRRDRHKLDKGHP